MSLGIDMVPMKTCSFNCIFCQLGCAPKTIVVRDEYVPLGEIADEFRDWLAHSASASYITLGGSGEPTLHSGIGKLIDLIHGLSSIKVAVLTNGSLLTDEDVRLSLCKADLVKVSFSAFDDESLRKINSPDVGIEFNSYYNGILDFRRSFKGEMWLEVFIVQGVNDKQSEVSKIAKMAIKIGADRIQLNTVVRPPANEGVKPVSHEQMLELVKLFGSTAEIIADQQVMTGLGKRGIDESEIVAMAKRHPIRALDVCALYGCTEDEASGKLVALVEQGVLSRHLASGTCYYKVMDQK